MKPNILVVDDDEDTRKAYLRALERIGGIVLEACDGAEGLEVLKNSSIDLIVLDDIMPRIGGMTFLFKIKQLGYKSKCIVISGFLNSKKIKEFKDLGALCVLGKPVSLDLLSDMVNDFSDIVASRTA